MYALLLTATTGKQALEELIANPKIKLLFSDVVMPGSMNGFELADEATKNHPEIKILLTSGYTQKISIAHNLNPLKDALLSKPYTLSMVAQRIRDLLDN